MLSISQETTCTYEIKCSVMHRLTHLHALCSNWPDSAEWLFPFKLLTETGGGGTKPGEKECSLQRFSPSALQNPMAADAGSYFGVRVAFLFCIQPASLSHSLTGVW